MQPAGIRKARSKVDDDYYERLIRKRYTCKVAMIMRLKLVKSETNSISRGVEYLIVFQERARGLKREDRRSRSKIKIK